MIQAASYPLRVLITGAYGLIGNLVYARLAEQPNAYDVYGLAKNVEPSARTAAIDVHDIPAGRLRLADVGDFAAVRQAFDPGQFISLQHQRRGRQPAP